MKQAKVSFNYSDYLLLPEDKRYEILDGDLHMVAAPSTRHQRVSQNLETALNQHIRDRKLGAWFHAPYDVVLSEENVVQPDILFVRKERLSVIGEKNLQGTPDLVIEILSEGTRRMDLQIKCKIYARFGIPEYWIVDPDADTVEVLAWTDRGYISSGLYWKSDRLSSPLLPELDLPLAEVFDS
jgi:Uma2 family endonuclease